MDTQPRYKIARTLEQLCGLLGIDVARVLRRVDLPADYIAHETRGITALEFFAGWNAMLAESGRDDAPLVLGQAYARGPFNTAFFAFTCSPTVAVGLGRLALFKPLTGPLHLTLRRSDAGALRLTKTSNVPSLPLPATFAATELTFLIEAIRTCTGHPVVAQQATLPGPVACHSALEAFLGCPVRMGPVASLVLAQADADRVLLSRNPDQWEQLEPTFRRQMFDQTARQSMTARLEAVLMEMLPAGDAQVQTAADRLRLSKRSLQRQLGAEQTSYQKVLDATRQNLARQYLQSTDLNIEEISYLLAYRDPNSFHRAFHNWTGQTPLTVRKAQG